MLCAEVIPILLTLYITMHMYKISKQASKACKKVYIIYL